MNREISFILHGTKCWVTIVLLTIVIAGKAQTTQQADSLHQRGRELVNEGKIAEGRECMRLAMEIRKQLLGEVSEGYITSLNNYAYSYGAEKNYQKAMELQEQVINLCEKLQTPHRNIGMYTTNMGRYYYLNGDKAKAANMWEQAIPLVEKHGEIYEFLLNSLGSVYGDSGDQQGISRIMALMEEHNQHELTKPCDEPKCMLERAQYYGTTGNQAKAKECYLNVLSMPMDDETKTQVHETYASYLGSTVRDFAAAADYYLSAANIRKSISGETEVYANLMYKTGMYAFLGKKYEEAVSAYQTTIDFYKKHNSEAAKKNTAKCMKGMGNAYSGMNEYAKARDCYHELVKYYEQNNQADEEYPKAILRLAKAEKFNKEYTMSIDHHKQAMILFSERGMNNDYADAASSLQLCYVYAGIDETVDNKDEEAYKSQMAKMDEIIKQELDVLELTRTYLGKLVYARSLATLGGCYEMKEDWENSVKYYELYIEAVREAIRDEFRMQSEAERMKVWGDEKKEITQMLELLIDLPEEQTKERQQMGGIAYDAELLSKGILLNSSIEFGKILAAKGDARLKEIYEQTKTNETEIERLRKSASSDEDFDKILKLTQQNQTLQLDLYRGCAEYADFTNYISYTWKDVQKALLPTDIAIEFAAIGNSILIDGNQLVALVLTKDVKMPQLIKVCGLNKLNEIVGYGDDVFNKTDIGDIIWGGIQQHLAGKKRLFFSADGALNRIAIEYLQYDGKPLSEQYEIYRLSSTKELCFKRESVRLTKVALFGDVNYNEKETKSEATQRSLASLRASGDAGGFANLSNTLREINEIQGVLKSKSVKDIGSFRDTEASKSAFMLLSDTKVNMLHIATHGIYKDIKKTTDAESMQNSLLAFAGANLNDSALVTAADIATMNLRQCDLAVLSACETGLGKLGGDGVFGLQRGFKNAGVYTLLMSLKNVYDDSTADLMISFYKHLVNGATKREALVKAQQDIRAKGFNDPKYWATFILLDAL
ncbi:MAG: CHAT domain-containing protein [Prevotella sp.]|nr:CHAT domain-containing protein [Prevotella sp.]